MLVSFDSVPLRVRCPHLIEECYDEKGEFQVSALEGKISEEEYEDVLSMYYPKQLATGLYASGFNLDHVISGIQVKYSDGVVSPRGIGTTHRDTWGMALKDVQALTSSIPNYGVADSVEQILEYYKDFVEDPVRQYVISLTLISKADEPESGGWRWHKWGPYIGAHTIEAEYIYDEPIVEEVICFHIYEIKLPES